MNPSRYLFVDLKDESRRIKPSYFFMMRCLLYSKLECGALKNQEGGDEDVNVYLAHLLNSLADPAYLENSKQYLHRYDHEVFKRLQRSTDARLKYAIYKTNADFLLISVGVFDNAAQWMTSGKSGRNRWHDPSEEASIGRGRTYYHFAYTYSQQVNRSHPAVTEVLEKLSVGFDRYIKVLSHMRGEYLDLVKALSQGEVYHLERTVDKEEQQNALRRKKDEFLDKYLEWRRTGSPQSLDSLRRAAAEIQSLDPGFRFQEPETDLGHESESVEIERSG